jgi:hypothetical protein
LEAIGNEHGLPLHETIVGGWGVVVTGGWGGVAGGGAQLLVQAV